MNIFEQIRVELPFEFETITNLNFSQQVDDHTWLEISGVVTESDIKTCTNLEAKTGIKLYMQQGGDELIFSGLLCSVHVMRKEQMEVTLRAVDYSILLDIEIKTRSFQRETMCYTELIKEILEEYDGELLVREQKDDSISAPFIQYGETDWQFIKRLSSRYGSGIYLSVTENRPQIYLGIGKGNEKRTGNIPWQMEKQMEEYMRFRQHQEVREQSFLAARMKGRMHYQVGDVITYSDIDFIISEICGRMEQGEFIFSYRLIQTAAPHTAVQRIRELCGVMITGTVLEADRNKVKLHLDIDEEQSEGDAYWYPLGRTDWYCMPEIESQVALYIPSEDEREAYVMSLHRTDGEDNEKTQNPEERYMGTPYGQEMKITPESISFQANVGDVLLELTDGDGVLIKSSEGIVIEAGKRFLCHGQTFEAESSEQILLRTSRTAIVMDDLLQLKG